MRSGSWIGLGVLTFGLLMAGTALAQGDPSFDYSYEKPVYQDVMEDIRSLGLENDQSDNARCVNNPRSFSPPPCPEAVQLYEDFIEAQGIEDNHLAGRMFNSYIDGDHRNGDRLYARLKGYKLPRYKGPGEMIAGLGLRRPMGKRGEDCEFNYYAVLPCPGVVRAWQEFAEKHGLELNEQTAEIFEAYAERDIEAGDVLLAEVKGVTVAELRGTPPKEEDPPRLLVRIRPSKD